MREDSPNQFSPTDLLDGPANSLFWNILPASPCGSRFYPHCPRYPRPKLSRMNTLQTGAKKMWRHTRTAAGYVVASAAGTSLLWGRGPMKRRVQFARARQAEHSCSIKLVRSRHAHGAFMKAHLRCTLVLVSILFAASAIAAAEDSCQKLNTLTIPDVKIIFAQPVNAGDFAGPPTPNGSRDLTAPYKHVPAFCRVVAVAKPTHRLRNPAGSLDAASGLERQTARPRQRRVRRT
jgi:hypothetical protein